MRKATKEERLGERINEVFSPAEQDLIVKLNYIERLIDSEDIEAMPQQLARDAKTMRSRTYWVGTEIQREYQRFKDHGYTGSVVELPKEQDAKYQMAYIEIDIAPMLKDLQAGREVLDKQKNFANNADSDLHHLISEWRSSNTPKLLMHEDAIEKLQLLLKNLEEKALGQEQSPVAGRVGRTDHPLIKSHEKGGRE